MGEIVKETRLQAAHRVVRANVVCSGEDLTREILVAAGVDPAWRAAQSRPAVVMREECACVPCYCFC